MHDYSLKLGVQRMYERFPGDDKYSMEQCSVYIGITVYSGLCLWSYCPLKDIEVYN